MTNSKVNQQILIGGAVVFRENRNKRQFLLVKTKEDGDWEIPKVIVRRGESSVRAVIRLTAEQGGISARVLEEAGRYVGSTIVNGNAIPQKYFYYLMLQRGGSSELIGFYMFKWMEPSDALKKLSSKKEKEMFKSAREVLKEWETTHKIKSY
jgi:ADP-ribose pyrophosphatase YjhB (NUDIX family)